jgi:hypothetical protein
LDVVVNDFLEAELLSFWFSTVISAFGIDDPLIVSVCPGVTGSGETEIDGMMFIFERFEVLPPVTVNEVLNVDDFTLLSSTAYTPKVYTPRAISSRVME